MSVESDIFDALKALVANRVFPDVAPLSTALPYVTYQQIGGEVIQPLAGGVTNKKNGRFQVNVWASSRASAAALSLQVEEAMLSATVFTARAVGSQSSTHEPDLNLYGAMQDFTVWSIR